MTSEWRPKITFSVVLYSSHRCYVSSCRSFWVCFCTLERRERVLTSCREGRHYPNDTVKCPRATDWGNRNCCYHCACLSGADRTQTDWVRDVNTETQWEVQREGRLSALRHPVGLMLELLGSTTCETWLVPISTRAWQLKLFPYSLWGLGFQFFC